MTLADLVSYGNQAFRQMVIVLPQDPESDHQVIDVAEHKCVLLCVRALLFQEGKRMITPVSARIEMM